MAHWQEISELILPRSGRFLPDRPQQGRSGTTAFWIHRHPRAARTGCGHDGRHDQPGPPWFRLTTSDAELDEAAAVKTWLADVQRMMQMVFAKSNTYRALHSIYEELGAFGTASSVVVPTSTR